MLENTNNVNNYQIALNIRENEGLIYQRWTGGTFNANLMRIGYTGAITFDAYNSTNNAGTPTYLLGTDASGNVVKTLSTPGSLPQFTNIRSAAYTSLTGSSNDWFTLFQVTDTMGPINCKMFTYAHDSLEFSVTEGYGPSNAGSITIINSAHTSNGGFATVSAVRIDQNGYVEVQLFWSSGPTVNIGIMITGYNAPSLPASLATSTQTATIVDSVGVDISGLLRSKRQLIIGGTSSSLVANTVKLTNIGDSYISGNSGDKFGIGTAIPGSKLEVNGTINFNDSGDRGFICNPGTGTFSLGDIDELGGGAYISTDSTNMNFYAAGANIARLTDGGILTVTDKLGVGVTSFTAGIKFEVDGNIKADALSLYSGTTKYFSIGSYSNAPFINLGSSGGTITLGAPVANWVTNLYVQGTITATGDVIAYSDERLKSNIKTLDGSKVYEMRGVSFDKDGKKSSGVIAQEMEKVAPELVNEESEYLGVAYGNISGYLIEAIKELKAEIDLLKSKPCTCNKCNCNI